MGKKLTHEVFMNKVKEKNEKIRNGSIEIRGYYVNAKTPIACYCNLHNVEYNSRPDRVYYNAGCEECVRDIKISQRMSREEFIEKVKEKNEHVRNGDDEVSGEYNGFTEPIECRCNKHDVTWSPIAASLCKGIGCRECKKEKISEKKSMTHDEYVNGLQNINPTIKVLSKYEGMHENITVEFKCGHAWTTKAAQVYYKDIICPYCSNQEILIGFNDLWTTSATTAKLLTNQEDGYTVTKGSGQKKSFTCQLCGKVQPKIVKNVVNRGLQCSFCGDGISYPNKFCRAFLDQLPIDDYEVEWQPEWAKPYFYDNYFIYNNVRYILEADGNFHYSDKDEFGISADERKRIDEIKNQLALQHGIVLIRIDCRISNREYIKTHIVNSKLNDIFELNLIDWNECDKRAQKNLVKTACDLYMSGIKSTKEISQELKVSLNTVIRYLKTGMNFDWCDYNPKN